MQRSADLGETLMNRTCYSIWAKHAERLGMGVEEQNRLQMYRGFLTTGVGTSSESRSRDLRGGLVRGRSTSRGRSSSRGRSTSRGRSDSRHTRDSQPGPSRRRSFDRRDSDSYNPPKRGRSSHRRW